MKRMLSVLLAVSMILTLLPLQIFAAESAGAALEYSIGGVTLYDEEDIVLDEIPEGKFKVGVSIEALEGAGDALMLLAAYTEDGQYQSLLSSAVNKETDAAAFTVDNTAGKIAKLRAFVVRSFETMAPLSALHRSIKPRINHCAGDGAFERNFRKMVAIEPTRLHDLIAIWHKSARCIFRTEGNHYI